MMIQSLYCVVITLMRARALARDLPKSALNYILTSILFFCFCFCFFFLFIIFKFSVSVSKQFLFLFSLYLMFVVLYFFNNI